MTVFNRILYLYRKSESLRTPLEDFCTEALAGILQSDSKLLEDFAWKVLKIESKSPFRISTQRTFNLKEVEGLGRVDLVFQSESELCFIELKVNSTEADGQLEKYAQILHEQPNTISTHLRYCSLYREDKHGLDNFDQFRWADIAKFLLERTENNTLISEFYNFLKEKNMAGNERFNHEDLVGLKVYRDIALKVMDLFTRITPRLQKEIGTVSGGINASKQIIDQKRWAIFLQENNWLR